MDINYAVDTVILILKVHIILYGSQIVAQVLPARGAGSRKDPTLHPNFLKRSVT
jgi:tRNA A37 threonylcarbamoyladenosine dehydratase